MIAEAHGRCRRRPGFACSPFLSPTVVPHLLPQSPCRSFYSCKKSSLQHSPTQVELMCHQLKQKHRYIKMKTTSYTKHIRFLLCTRISMQAVPPPQGAVTCTSISASGSSSRLHWLPAPGGAFCLQTMKLCRQRFRLCPLRAEIMNQFSYYAHSICTGFDRILNI